MGRERPLAVERYAVAEERGSHANAQGQPDSWAPSYGLDTLSGSVGRRSGPSLEPFESKTRWGPTSSAKTIKPNMQQQIEVRFESVVSATARQCALLLRMQSANLNIKSYVSLKKGAQGTMTLISGPHVHKKSRDQYHTLRHCAFFVLLVRNTQDQLKFLDFYNQLCDDGRTEAGFELSFVHTRHQKVRLGSLKTGLA